MNQGLRFEDRGLMKIVSYWPILVCLFTAGAWYESSTALSKITDRHQVQIEEHEHRLTEVESAVKYLAEIVKEDRRSHDR
jgi:hypothetical protein